MTLLGKLKQLQANFILFLFLAFIDRLAEDVTGNDEDELVEQSGMTAIASCKKLDLDRACITFGSDSNFRTIFFFKHNCLQEV